jgi:restriction system protein
LKILFKYFKDIFIMARERVNKGLPTYDELMIPVIKALKVLGGSARIEELNEKVFELTNLSDEIIQLPHAENDSRTEIEYRLAWTRTYLKKYGILDNSERGIWALNQAEIDTARISVEEIVKSVREKDRQEKQEKNILDKGQESLKLDEGEQDEDWKNRLLGILFKISPDAFERLAQRILRESGFVQVDVTGRSGDGGIDGKGIIRVGGG